MRASVFAFTAVMAMAVASAAPAWGSVTRTETQWAPQGLDLERIPIRGTSTRFSRARGGEGNPGRAIVYDASIRANANSTNTSSAFVLSARLFHDLSLDGEMDSVSFSQSLYLDTTDAVSTFGVARFLMAQNIDGKRVVFAHEVDVLPLFGQWQTISAFDLREQDFARLDLRTGRLLAEEHPDFDAEFTVFGAGLGAGVVNDTRRVVRESVEMRIDNLRVTISPSTSPSPSPSPVPEPATWALAVSGLFMVAAATRLGSARRLGTRGVDPET